MFKTLSSIRLILFIFCLTWQTHAREINEVSFSDLKFTPLSSQHHPHEGWSASFNFNIDNGSAVSKGDYFSLSFPTVYRIKFDDNKPTTNATLEDDSEAFECFAAQQAAYKNEDTIFQCVAIKDLSSYSSLSGSLSFGLSFSSGGSAYQYEMQNADKFHSGTMQVSLTDQLSASVDFDSANFTKDIYTIGRSTTFDNLESYYLGMSCPDGYLLGGTQTINYDKENKGYNLDCSSVQVHLSDEFNDWSLPLKNDNAGANVDCSDDILKVNMSEAKANQMLWINALQNVSAGQDIIQHDVHLQYSCSNTQQKTTYDTQFSTTIEYTIYQASDSATLSGLSATSASSSAVTTPTITSTSTTGWTGTYNTTYSTDSTQLSGSSGVPTEEIIYYVETPSQTSAPETSTPMITTTTTTGWTGTYNTTYSTGSTQLSGSSGAPTEEIIIYVETPSQTSVSQTSTPVITTTTTNGWTGTYNTTYSTGSTQLCASSGVPTEEVIIYVETPSQTSVPETSTPVITTTTTNRWTGTYNTTYSTGSTQLSGSSGVPTEEIIIYVETPSQTSVPETSTPVITTTTTNGWTGTYNTTYSTGSTQLNASSGVPTEEIIIYVETPSQTSVPETSTPMITTTTTNGWTGTYNTTYSTGSTQLSGSSGAPTEEIIIYVETPSQMSVPETSTPVITTTTTNGWTGTYNTTYSTGSTQLSGSSGVPTEEIIIYVETPSQTSVPETSTPMITTTTTNGWTGTYNTTYSTGSTQLSASSGVPTEEIIYYVETPVSQMYNKTTEISATTSTSITGWTNTYGTTYSTAVTNSENSTGSSETPVSSVLASTSEVALTSTTAQTVTTPLQSTYFTTQSCSESIPSTSSFISSIPQTPSPSSSESSVSVTTTSQPPSSTSTAPATTASSTTSTSTSIPSSGFSSAAAASTTSSPTSSPPSSTPRFSLGFSLDQGSLAQPPSSTPCSVSTEISTATATITQYATTTATATASVTQTVTHKIGNWNCSAETFHSSSRSYSSKNSTNSTHSLAAYSGQGLVLKRSNGITVLLAMMIFIL